MGTIKEISDPTIVIGALTDAGRSGKNNEDNFVVFESQSGSKEGTTGWLAAQVLLVADGIGGNVAGEMASQMAVDTFREAFASAQSQSLSQRLVEALESANQAIYQKTLAQPNLHGMGTTVVAAALAGSRLYVAHAGDSRAYLIRKGKAYQLTLDHTWAQEAIEAGRLTAAQAREHPNRHVIKRYVGIAPTVEIDPLLVDINRGPLDPDQIQSWPKTDHLDLQPDDTLLLCSDGLTDVVSDKEIEQTVTRNQPQEAARKLIDLANKAGGPDNITVLVLQRRQPGAPVAKAGGRSPVMAVALTAALVVITAVAWLFLRGQSDTIANSTTPSATVTETAVEAVAAAPATPEATITPSATATPVPTVATATATSTPTLIVNPSPTIAEAPNTGSAVDANKIISEAASTLANSAAAVITAIDSEATPTVTSTRLTTTQRAPTSTPIPEASKTPTPTATATPTITRIATQTPNVVQATTATRSASQATATPQSNSNMIVNLTSPANGERGEGRKRFVWQSNSQLQTGQAFEVVFWQKGQEPLAASFGIVGPTTMYEVTVDLNELYNTGNLERGEYQWSVLLVETNPYKRLQLLHSGYQFFFEPSSDRNSDGSGTEGEGGR